MQCRERKAPLRHPTLGTKPGKISPKQLLGTVHHSAGSSRATAHLQTSKTSASMPLRSEEAACQPTKLLLSSRRGKKRSWGAELATAQRAGLSPNRRIPTSPREGNKIRLCTAFLQSSEQQNNSPSMLDSGKWFLSPPSPLLPYHGWTPLAPSTPILCLHYLTRHPGHDCKRKGAKKVDA